MDLMQAVWLELHSEPAGQVSVYVGLEGVQICFAAIVPFGWASIVCVALRTFRIIPVSCSGGA
jgi:hypothetical protein